MPHLPARYLHHLFFGICANVAFIIFARPYLLLSFLHFCDIFGYLASKGFFLAWLLALTKSLASLVSRVVGLFYLPLTGRKQINYATTSHANDSLRKHPFLHALRRWGNVPAAKSAEKRMFSQATRLNAMQERSLCSEGVFGRSKFVQIHFFVQWISRKKRTFNLSRVLALRHTLGSFQVPLNDGYQ